MTRQLPRGDEWIEDSGALYLINHDNPSEKWLASPEPVDLERAR
jgi:hypothetical protein